MVKTIVITNLAATILSIFFVPLLTEKCYNIFLSVVWNRDCKIMPDKKGVRSAGLNIFLCSQNNSIKRSFPFLPLKTPVDDRYHTDSTYSQIGLHIFFPWKYQLMTSREKWSYTMKRVTSNKTKNQNYFCYVVPSSSNPE